MYSYDRVNLQIQRSPNSPTKRSILYNSQLPDLSKLLKKQATRSPLSTLDVSQSALVDFTQVGNPQNAFSDSSLGQDSTSEKLSSSSAPPSNYNRSEEDKWPDSDPLLAYDDSELYERVNPPRHPLSNSFGPDRLFLPHISSTMYQEANEPLNSGEDAATIDTEPTIPGSDYVDGSGSNYLSVVEPRGRSLRFNPSIPYRPSPHPQQHHGASQSQGNSQFTPQQPPMHQGQQQQQFILQQPSQTVYYSPFHPHSHHHMQQTTPPNTYPVNQGYMSGPSHTSAGPSIPTYAYSQPYPEHPMHGYGFPHTMGSMATAPHSQYPEVESHQHQSQRHQQTAHGHETGSELLQGYVPMVVTTAGAYGYTIPAFAPTGGPIFTPQYRAGPMYSQYAPMSPQGYSAGYPQAPIQQMHRPPPQRQHSHQQHHHQGPSSPVIYSPTTASQNPPHRGYSPNVSAQHPGVSPGDPHSHSQSGTRNTVGSTNPDSRAGDSGRNVSSPASGGSIVETRGPGHQALGNNNPIAVVEPGRGRGGTIPRSPFPAGMEGSQSSFSYTGNPGRRPSMANQANQGTWSSRTLNDGDVDLDSKAERSEWVMWVGNVPGDASLDELNAFFAQGPPLLLDGVDDGSILKEGGGDGQGATITVDGNQKRVQTTKSAEVDGSVSAVSSANATGVVSVFLISRSNCAFVNYATEEHLRRCVEWFNGKPLRSPQIDPRCPKLVCRVRKKGDDLRAGVGGQRGIGIHARWAKEMLGKRRGHPADQSDMEVGHRPPLVHGGPAAGSKKSSSGSGSSVSHASTTSSLLATHFPDRYFIIKSLTQHDVDLSVQTGLWATQMHNQETLDRAYRTSQFVYLIFSVNKSGEFFGYAVMDGPISQVERNPAIEWASREGAGTGVSKMSPTARRSNLVQPTIEEERESAPSENVSERAERSDKSNTRSENVAEPGPRYPLGGGRHTWGGEISDKQRGDPVPHQASEPLDTYRARTADDTTTESPVQSPPSSGPLSSNPLAHSSMQRLLMGQTLQDSPDPLTPNEDKKLHSLEETSLQRSASRRTQSKSKMETEVSEPVQRPTLSEHQSRASAPAEMGERYKRLSQVTAVSPPGTWDGRMGEKSIEEEDEDLVEELVIQSAPLSPTSPNHPGDLISSSVLKGDPSADADTKILPLSPKPVDGQPEQGELVSDKPGGREQGWGTSFKVKWIQTKPLPFSRTRHLRNPWNHDREVKVSRDGTELEPTVGQKLIEEWDRPEGAIIPPKVTAQPNPPVSPISPTQLQSPPARGRGRGFLGRPQRDGVQ
ncbi:hypothetical protein FRC20_004770 [Serendipita sp. 405]|nr:hypothetical protein FRC20_004770 [Serendipita sp. 405]